MNKLKSFYLEVLRIIASFYVFVYHVGTESIEGEEYLAGPGFAEKYGLIFPKAHCYVMVFFVLSGYLITMSGTRPNVTFKKFMIARLGRIYSVMLPALIFSIAVAVLLVNIYPDPFLKIENYGLLVPRFILNAVFMAPTLTFWSMPPLNGAFWSVQYEVIYYLLFAFAVLFKGKWKWPLLILFIALSIPKALLLFPVWLLGSFLYKVEGKIKLGLYASLFLSVISTGLFLYYIHYADEMPFQKPISDNKLFGQTLFLSWNYLADYVFAPIVALNMLSIFKLSGYVSKYVEDKKIFNWIYDKSRTIGNCTYTLYLFHTPLLFLYVSLLPYDKFNFYHVYGVMLLVCITVYFLAQVTEWKVDFWRNSFEKVVQMFEKAFGKIFNIQKV